jgi:hypothetical protein
MERADLTITRGFMEGDSKQSPDKFPMARKSSDPAISSSVQT